MLLCPKPRWTALIRLKLWTEISVFLGTEIENFDNRMSLVIQSNCAPLYKELDGRLRKDSRTTESCSLIRNIGSKLVSITQATFTEFF